MVVSGRIGALLLLTAPWVAAQPPMQPGRWQGSYDCAQGTTSALLTVRKLAPQGEQQAVDAMFEFGGGPRPRGAYLLSGIFDPRSRRLSLEPTGWLLRPGQYVAVGFSGMVSVDGTSFDGRMNFHLCSGIQLRSERPAVAPPAAVPGNGVPDGVPAGGPVPVRPGPASTPQQVAGPARTTPSQPPKSFAPLFRMTFGARIDMPGCWVKTVQEKTPCLMPVPMMFSDRPVPVNPNGQSTLWNAEIGFAARTLLDPLVISDARIAVELRNAQLKSIEISPRRESRSRVDGKALIARLTRHFGEPQVLIQQKSELFLSEQERKARSNPTVEVTTYRWQAEDSAVEFECYYGCTLKAVASEGR